MDEESEVIDALQSHKAGGVFTAFCDCLRSILLDKGVLLLLVFAPFFYSFFYPWFYDGEVAQRVPVGIVVKDNSELARQMVRYANAGQRIAVTLITGDEHVAEQAMLRGEIDGYALIPKDFQRKIASGIQVQVPVYAHGSYPMLSKQVQFGFATAFGTISAGVAIHRMEAQGLSEEQAIRSVTPLTANMYPLFNPSEGYGSFVVPAVALLIIQQTQMIGLGMLVATAREYGLAHYTGWQWLGRLLACWIPGMMCCLYWFGWVFLWQGYPSGGNPGGQLLLLAAYSAALVGCGSTIGWLIGERERVMQALLFTSLPLVFLAGFSWPMQALPTVLKWVRYLSPSTSGIAGSLRLNQGGAPLSAALFPICVLATIALVTWTYLCLAARPKPGEPVRIPDLSASGKLAPAARGAMLSMPRRSTPAHRVPKLTGPGRTYSTFVGPPRPDAPPETGPYTALPPPKDQA